MHLSKPSSSSSSHQHICQPLRGSDPHAISCSKRSCLCCTLWIDAYNYTFGTGWLTNGCDGKPCAAWALPGDAATHGIGVHEDVVRGVETRLAETLWWLYPNSSDEGSDSDEESLARLNIALGQYSVPSLVGTHEGVLNQSCSTV